MSRLFIGDYGLSQPWPFAAWEALINLPSRGAERCGDPQEVKCDSVVWITTLRSQ